MQSLWDDPDRAVGMGRAPKSIRTRSSRRAFLETLLGIYREVLDAGIGARR